jgi:hypothetical protein
MADSDVGDAWLAIRVEELESENLNLKKIIDTLLCIVKGECKVYPPSKLDGCLWLYDPTTVNGCHLHFNRDGECCLLCRLMRNVATATKNPVFGTNYCGKKKARQDDS